MKLVLSSLELLLEVCRKWAPGAQDKRPNKTRFVLGNTGPIFMIQKPSETPRCRHRENFWTFTGP